VVRYSAKGVQPVKIIIVGAGGVGFHVAGHLAMEKKKSSSLIKIPKQSGGQLCPNPVSGEMTADLVHVAATT
jgi:malate/lactate dehydrogenase